MIELQLARWLLAALLLSVSLLIWRRNAGCLLAWMAYCYFTAGSDAIPVAWWSAEDWRVVWPITRVLPLVVLGLAVLDAYSETHRFCSAEERWRLLTFGAGVGAFAVYPVLATFSPASRFEGFAILRQCAFLGLAAGHSAAWWYIRRYEPLWLPKIVRRHGLLLCGWLWVNFVESTSAEGGLLWHLIERKGAINMWIIHGDICLAVQSALAVGWLVSLRAAPKTQATIAESPSPLRFRSSAG